MKFIIIVITLVFSVNTFACKMTSVGFQKSAIDIVIKLLRKNKPNVVLDNLNFVSSHKILVEYEYLKDNKLSEESSIYTITNSPSCKFSVKNIQILNN